MTGFVIDASSVLAWCFEDESSPGVDDQIERVAAEGAAVPGVWHLEIANALVVGERRGRLSAAEGLAFIALLEQLPIVTDRVTSGRVLHDTMNVAREYGLSIYDSAYLELAMRLRIPLVTGDARLGKAAKRAGVPASDRP